MTAAAALAGATWFASKKISSIRAKNAADFVKKSKRKYDYAQRAAKAKKTRAARKSIGYYKSYKTGGDYSKMVSPSRFSAAQSYLNPTMMSRKIGQFSPNFNT